jgi:hypothetical protein
LILLCGIFHAGIAREKKAGEVISPDEKIFMQIIPALPRGVTR